VENAGSGGKRGVWWKTRGLSGKHGGKRIFLTKMRSLNFVIVNCNENQFRFSAWNTFFDQKLSKLNKSYYTWLVSCTARQNMLLSKFAKIRFSVTWIKYFTSKLVGFLEGAGKKYHCMILRADLNSLKVISVNFLAYWLNKWRIKKRSTCGNSWADCVGKWKLLQGNINEPMFLPSSNENLHRR